MRKNVSSEIMNEVFLSLMIIAANFFVLSHVISIDLETRTSKKKHYMSY